MAKRNMHNPEKAHWFVCPNGCAGGGLAWRDHGKVFDGTLEAFYNAGERGLDPARNARKARQANAPARNANA